MDGGGTDTRTDGTDGWDRETDRQKTQTDGWMVGQAGRQGDRQTDRQAGGQAGRQRD